MKKKKIFMLTFMALFMAIMVGCTNTVQAKINYKVERSTDVWKNLAINKIPTGSKTEKKIEVDTEKDVFLVRETDTIGTWFDWFENFSYDNQRIWCIQSLHNISEADPGDHDILNIWDADKEQSEDMLLNMELIGYYGYEFNWGLCIGIIVAGFINGIFILGFAEVIQLLQDIKNKNLEF